MKVIRVSKSSVPKSVAGAISARLRDFGEVEVQAVGANAINQAIKSLIVARTHCKKDNTDLYIQPSFSEIKDNIDNIVTVKMHVIRIPLVERSN